jgi:hypothetical protein
MSPEKQAFLKSVQDDFFKDLRIDLDGLKDYASRAFTAFGTVEVKDEGVDEDGLIALRFIDNDTADMAFAPEGVEVSEEQMDMSTTLCTLYLDKTGLICGVSHGFKYFTPANKENVLMAAFLIGKKVEGYEQEV